MNDPGLEEPIKDKSREVEKASEADEEELERQDEQTFLNPRLALPWALYHSY